MMKVSGAELLLWQKEAWPDKNTDDWCWDNEIDDFVATRMYDTYDDLGGVLRYQGNDPDQEIQELDIATLIRKWRKSRNTKILCVQVPNTCTNAELKNAIKVVKGRIIRS